MEDRRRVWGGSGVERRGEARRWRLAACGCLRHGRCRIAVAGARVCRDILREAQARAPRGHPSVRGIHNSGAPHVAWRRGVRETGRVFSWCGLAVVCGVRVDAQSQEESRKLQWRSRSGDRTGGASRGPQKLSRFSQKNLSPPHRHHGADHNTPIPLSPQSPAQPKSFRPLSAMCRRLITSTAACAAS